MATVIESVSFNAATRVLTIISGGVSYTVSIPDTYVTGAYVSGGNLIITQYGAADIQVALPASTDVKLTGLSYDATTSVLTATNSDGSTVTTTLPTPSDVKLASLAFNSTTSVLTATNSDGSTATTTIPITGASTASPFTHFENYMAPSLTLDGTVQYMPTTTANQSQEYIVVEAGRYVFVGHAGMSLTAPTAESIMFSPQVCYVKNGTRVAPANNVGSVFLNTVLDPYASVTMPFLFYVDLAVGDAISYALRPTVLTASGTSYPLVINGVTFSSVVYKL